MSLANARPETLLKGAESLAALPFARASKAPLSILSDGDMLRWRYGERLEDVLEDACRRHAERVAVSLDGLDITFAELDARANQMARHFRALGIMAGDRVGVLLDRGLDSYVTLFGLLKARAAYVPIDANHPADRLAYILEDSHASFAVTNQRFADRFPPKLPLVVLDRARYEIARESDAPLGDEERGAAAEPLCYVLYTSGTTGRPKGVAVAHPSICNFVRVAAEILWFRRRRPRSIRACRSPSISRLRRSGCRWPLARRSSPTLPARAACSARNWPSFWRSATSPASACVPTLLASIERDLPETAHPADRRRSLPARAGEALERGPAATLLNSYGPTETTVTATLGIMDARKRPVTIGRPLPTYSRPSSSIAVA